MKPVLKDILSDVERILDRADENQYDTLIAEITAAKRIFVAGAGRSLLMMKAFAMRLMHIGLTVYVVGETTTPAAKRGDLLIVGSGSGETATMKTVADRARNAGVRLLVITTNDGSTLAEKADAVVRLPASVNHLNPGGSSWQPGGNSFEQSLLLLGDAAAWDVAKLLGTDISGKLDLHANLE